MAELDTNPRVLASDLNREECSARLEAEFRVPVRVLSKESRSDTVGADPRVLVIDLKREVFSIKLEVRLSEPLRDRTTER